MTGIYNGRLACDGNGNLLADPTGLPVAYHEGSYVFLEPGEPSHNERHHQQFVEFQGTQDQDPELPGFAEEEGNTHHYGIAEDDPHRDEDAPNKTRLRFDPDSIAGLVTSHTEAYRG